MKNLKISTRLILAFGFLLSLIALVAGIALWNIQDTRAGIAEIDHRQDIAGAVHEIKTLISARVTEIYGLAQATDSASEQYFRRAMDASTAGIAVLVKEADSQIADPRIRQLFDSMEGLRARYLAAVDELVAARARGDGAKVQSSLKDTLPPIESEYLASIDSLTQMQESLVSKARADAAAADAMSEKIMLLATILAILLGVFSAWRVLRAITIPLGHAVALAQQVAQRDLSAQISVQSNDELGALVRALAQMMENLRAAIGQVNGGAHSIALAAGQISAGNLDLSSRTEQQSSSLAETAATMEEITSTVRQNADNSHQANALASSAATTASDAGRVVQNLVATMKDINEKSRQVSDIIGVIDSIAFQTNILALNAAVEAARAGEQGRGFAVVASEVRALAQRSATAAKEIKTLIDTSVESAQIGDQQAHEAGDTMQKVVSSIQRVTDIVAEISAASGEQTSAIEQINIAVAQMDDVTRQNASLVEESAAAAGSLQEQADSLERLVATFKLEQGAGRGASPGAGGAPLVALGYSAS